MRTRRAVDPYAELRKHRVRLVFRRCAGPCGQDCWLPAGHRQCAKCQARTDRIRRKSRLRALTACLRLAW
ncbi:hypothetical protein [Gandjariella thermophila]|uniref:Uncharacterized protein n=1 Tax=Gandjariella thermophila TaxID=1931992 RepID=A0A4D4J825_9PSEU|nr:hypothetical protein [Gandjariella thermophila]GDY30808.1 hypothetical protein GTS_24410 [Gandjariella thermophila]